MLKRKPRARILDMDGTLVNVSTIRHFVLRIREEKDFASFHAASEFCSPIQQALDYATETVALGMTNVVVTARMEEWRGPSTRWLENNMFDRGGNRIPYDGPIMRRQDDFRSDRIVKLEIFRYLMRNYDIRGAIDDNPQVVALHREMGWPVTVVPGWDDEAANSYVSALNRVRGGA